MLDRLRRSAALISLPALMLSLAACGSDESTFAKGFDAVSISGDVGSTPEFDWKSQLASGDPDEKTITEGDGEKLEKGDQVLVNFTIGNGFSQSISLDTHSDTLPGFVATVGGEPTTPQAAGDLFTQFVSERIEPGMTIGTRFAITAGVDKAFADYQTQFTAFDIGNADGLVFVVDLEGVVLDGPEGKKQKPAAWAPSIVEKKGVPASLDFTDTPKPSGKLQVTTLVQGTGPKVKKGTMVVANYLGQVFDADQPFDESFSRKQTLHALMGADTEQLESSAGPVVKGWSQGLIGVPTGSRVLIQIPPKLGYDKTEQGTKGKKGYIPAGSTLYFVVDVLGVA